MADGIDTMTLIDWSEQHDRFIYNAKGGSAVYCEHSAPAYFDLFYLSDYYVTTISGQCVYLMPRL